MDSIGVWFGRPIAQYWEDIQLWEKVLNEYQGRLNWIIELGTWQGGMSFYLYAQASARGITFTSFDDKTPSDFVAGYIKRDIFEEGLENLYFDVKEKPGILFCDNGDKPKEVLLFSDQIHPESLIAVHDWGTEFIQKDIPQDFSIAKYSSTTVFLARTEYLAKIGKPGFSIK